MSDEVEPGPKKRRGTLLALAGGTLGLAAIGYVAACYHFKDTIPDGTTVAGKSIGGMTQDQARRQITGLHLPATGSRATVTAGSQKVTFDPSPAWKPDATRTLRGVSGFSLSPARLIDQLNGGGSDITPTFDVDMGDLKQIVKSASAASIEGSPTQARVKFVGGKVVVVDGSPGHGIDESAVANDVAAHWPTQREYTARLVERQSDVSNDAVLAFARGDAKKAMASPLTVKANGDKATMTPADVSNVISSGTDAQGRPTIKVDRKALLDYVLSHSTDMQKDAAVDAKVVWKDGKPSVQDGRAGKQIDESKVESIVAAALVGNHVAELPMTAMKPQVTASDIHVDSLPTTSMAHFESKFPLGASQNTRIHNITTAINRLNGQVVLPGEQFSLLRALGYNFSKESGYVEAGTLQNGIHVDGQGGGVSQVSTTVYNTAFFAGVQLDSHTSHAVYLDRYPVGREATLWNPGVDNTWTNDTGQIILIKASVDGNKVVMDFYGHRKYDVSTKTGPRTDVVQPKHRTIKNVKGCENSLGNGTEGFQIDVWRTLKQGSKVVRTEKIHTKYQPDDVITCEG